jgi:succinyl-CoA synthetase beta subunit
VLARNADDAVAAAAHFAGDCVLKMCSAEVAHKTELGGVVLGLRGEGPVREAFRTLAARADSAGVVLDGILVSPQRSAGLELLVGVNRGDAMGGALVEVLDDSALRLLPVTADDVREMLGELRSRALFDGHRGAEPIDLAELVSVILRVAEVAQALPAEVEAVEVNPLLITPTRIEALDALITLRPPSIDSESTTQEPLHG